MTEIDLKGEAEAFDKRIKARAKTWFCARFEKT